MGLLHVETKLINILKQRRKEAPHRHFVKILYTNNACREMRLRQVLRDPAIFAKHPNPEVGAAILVCDKFEPQWQAHICNYAKAAMELDIDRATTDTLEACRCLRSLHRPTSDHLHCGHVLSVDSGQLRWPYLRSLAKKGKKYRLEGTKESMFSALHSGLERYVEWQSRCNQNDPTYHHKLVAWAEAVEAACLKNWRVAAFNQQPLPEGFPGLHAQIREAHKDLVFLLDDRAHPLRV